MPRYVISQYVDAPNAQVAAVVGDRLKQGQEGVTIPVTIGAQTIEPAWMEVETGIIDRIVKRVVAGVIIYYISKSLKNWAKE